MLPTSSTTSFSAPSLAKMSIKRLVNCNHGRNYLKSLPTLMTPGLVDDVYNSLIKIDSKFCGYLPHDANIDKNNNYLPSNKDYSCIFKQFGNDYKKIKNLKCCDANMRKSLIETHYMSFVDMENKTDDEWRLFFQRIPLTNDNINDQSIQNWHLFKQLVNQHPFVAFKSNSALFSLIDNISIEMCIAYIKEYRYMRIPPERYEKMRKVINESAENQLAAINGGFYNGMIQIQYQYRDLYDPFKSRECIYAWVKHGHLLHELPHEFYCVQVILEVLRLGNTDVFQFQVSKQADECLLLECLAIDPSVISYIDADKITPAIRDYIQNNVSVEFFRFIPKRLHTQPMCRKAIEYSLDYLCQIDDEMCTPELIKFVLDNQQPSTYPLPNDENEYDDDDNVDVEKDFYTKLVHVIEHQPNAKDMVELKWCTANKIIETENIKLFFYAIDMLENSMLENILNKKMDDYYFLTHVLIYPCVTRRLHKFRGSDIFLTLVSHCPKLIVHCKNFVNVTEEMSCDFLQHDFHLFRYCLMTPKILEIICERDPDSEFFSYLWNVSKSTLSQILSQFIKSPSLWKYAWGFIPHFIKSGEINFHVCSTILANVESFIQVDIVLQKLENANYWLLYKCFDLACYTKRDNKKYLLSNWRQNVIKLGSEEEFNTTTICLILSFQPAKDDDSFNSAIV